MRNLLSKVNYIFDKKQKLQSVLLCIGLFVGALLELVGVSFITQLVTLISNPEKIHSNEIMQYCYDFFNMTSDRQFFLFVVIALIFVYLIKNLYLLWINYVQYTFVFNNQLRLSGRLIDCYLKKPYTYHLDNNSAEMVRNVMLDSERFFQMLLSVFLTLSELLVSALLCVFLLIVDPVITISVVAILAVFTGLYLILFKGKAKKYGKTNQIYDGKMHQSINQALGAVKDIKILHREKYFADSFLAYGKKKMTAVRNNNVLGQFPKYLIETVCIGTVLLVLVFKIYKGEDLNTMIPQLAAFAIAAFKLLPSVSKINNYANLIVFLKPSVDLIYRDIKDTEDMVNYEIADESGNIIEINDDGSQNKDTCYVADKISINNIVYRYPHTDRDVLNGISFEIPLGKSIGFIGESGSGKSTLADVILGILTPTSGTVMYGNMDVHKHPLKWSKKLAYIPQSIFLCDDTIRNNVAFGIDEDKIDDEKVWKALREAQLEQFVKSQPDGLDSMVGERGVRISGGQRQRIGIARALYDNPEILVLDEATSALDTGTESAVMEAIDKLSGTMTLIIIAHRLTTIKNCDYVYKVENGNIYSVDPSSL
ncbi:MAG: ABC transporter ATP-binding protein [Lachnospiraceae bacterium]|jgi:ABC-type multidrug transport system fused ATPase/permease subunit|nr:ABC transporter ATP-binding protein/permease [Lachnospiraceae bacterium]MCI6409505.1 ABC transporter ATP-binding protein/permease [Lachnospiraceae bacterium]MCI6665252.1 ABC transporter ATP-binding protein/permease [Lachnospiraceae bacterium]MDY4836930.1 ABC transporter ATP-binding protein [Lachnospiraceae bacterium]MDY5641219.1 ABC transporter ATP-binding protein [Lachnospiraceae bacterium]